MVPSTSWWIRSRTRRWKPSSRNQIDTIFDPVVEGILQPKPAAKEFERPWIEATQDVIAEHWAAFRKPPEELPTRAPRTNFARGARGGVLITSVQASARTASNAVVYLVSRSRIRKRNDRHPPGS